MKIVKENAGALTNFEVLDLLNSRGASRDTTRVIAPVATSEYKVYDYLVETPAFTQTRESVTKFAEKCKDFKVAKAGCKDFKLAKAEILNITNLRPSSIVELMPIIEKPDDRNLDPELDSDRILDRILEFVQDLLPPPPKTDTRKDDEEDETENNGEES